MSENPDIKNLTTQEKTKSVVYNYDDIAREYAEEFYNDTSDNKYIDKFLQSLNGKKILDAGCRVGEDCKYIEHNFRVDSFDREVTSNEFELGDGKLIVFSSNEKVLKYPRQKNREYRDDEKR